MVTNTSIASTATSSSFILSQDQAAKFSATLNFAIIPCLSATGVCGNVASMFLLARQGFRKSSNVLLFALALFDVLFLAGINNFSPHVLAGNDKGDYTLSESVNFMLYIFCMLLSGASYIGLYGSILVPVLITGDRILVIFLPLNAHTIVTPLRTLLAILCAIILIIACFIYQFVLCLRFDQALVNGVVRGRFVATERIYQDVKSGAFQVFLSILNYLTGVVPTVLVTIGCVVIGLKIAMIARRRRTLTSSDAASKNTPSAHIFSKSTRVLLEICCLYILCRSFAFLIICLLSTPALMKEKPMRSVLEVLNKFSHCINSVGNFIIYFATNKSFKYSDLGRNCIVKNRRWH